MTTITRDRLLTIQLWRKTYGPGSNVVLPAEEAEELARIALASLDAEPVAYMYKDNLHADARFSLHTRFGNWSQEDINEYEITEIPLYTATPAPVSDSLLSELLGIAKRAAYEADECAHAEFSDDSMEHSAAIVDWERCADMLQGAEPVTTGYKLRDAVETIRNSGIAIDAERIFAERDALNAPDCWCRTCRPITLTDMRFVVCPECGNKRCPHANDHRNTCTGSNEPGQEGSAYPAAPQQEAKNV